MEILYGEIKQRLLYWLLTKKGNRISQRMHPEEMREPIDFVVTWVDSTDEKWRAEKEKYQRAIGIYKEHRDNGEERYRNWDLFKYWFRAVEKYAPWVRHVYLITEGHVPEWLNLECPKLKHVKHSDYIPAEYLPTFNSNVIELNMHRIEGLSEFFVNFNDDMFLTRPCKPEDFFSAGKPFTTVYPVPLRNHGNDGFCHSRFSTLGALNRVYSGHVVETVKKHPEIWFHKDYGYGQIEAYASMREDYILGMYFSHCATAFRKSTFAKVWEELPSYLEDTSSHRFRTPQDVMHQIMTMWDIMNGNVYPVPVGSHGKPYYNLKDNMDDCLEAIAKQKYLTICVNDSEDVSHAQFLQYKKQVADMMESVFPEKCSFEK